MKLRILLCSLLAAGLATGVTAIAKEEKNLEAQAKVARADAEKIALNKAPGVGVVREVPAGGDVVLKSHTNR